MKRFYEVNGLLMQTASAPPAPAGDINQTAARPEPNVEWPEEGGELPDQSFNRTTMLPGIRIFKLPTNLAQLWADVPMKDTRQYLPNGQANPTFGQQVNRKMLKMSKSAPLVVVGGPDDGQPLTWNPSSSPRPRGGKRDDPKTAWVSELAYLLDVGLQGNVDPKQRVRPTTVEQLVAEINKYAGKTVRLKSGLSATCRPENVRYIAVAVATEGGGQTIMTQADPAGIKGCGAKYYTKSFKNADAGQPEDPANPGGAKIPDYETAIPCTGQRKQQDGSVVECGSALRGFESVDEILTPA